jgi:hypothetical protein
MADIGLAAFSIFFMGISSFLGHQRALAEGHGRSNCETLFDISAIPSDNYIRLMLDGASPAAFDGLFMKAIEAAGPLTPFRCLDGRVPIALDGTEHVCSRKIKCERCSTRRRADSGIEYFHAFLGASMVPPGHKQILPLPPDPGQAQGHDLSRRRTGRRSRIANAMPPSAGWPGMVPASLTCGRSISGTICLPASLSSPRSTMPAATSSSPASHLRIRPLLSTCWARSDKSFARPSANAANAPPPSTVGSAPCRCVPPSRLGQLG